MLLYYASSSHSPIAFLLLVLGVFLQSSPNGVVNADEDISLRDEHEMGDGGDGGDGEFSMTEGEFYCPLNDDGCDWMPEHGNKYCFKLFQHERTLMEAAEICEAMSIAGCPSKLMAVERIPKVAKAMMMGGDVCLGQYRADCHYGEHDEMEGWFDMENERINFPEMFTGGNPDEPLDAINEKGMTCVADFFKTEITGNTNKSEPASFACSSCIIEIPFCPSLCEDCFKPPIPVGCDNGPICDFDEPCDPNFDTRDGCISRIFDVQASSILPVINLICSGICTNVLITITSLEGSNVQLFIQDPSDDTVFLSFGSDPVKTYNAASAGDSVLKISLSSMGGIPGLVRILAVQADNAVCVGLVDTDVGLPVECYDP